MIKEIHKVVNQKFGYNTRDITIIDTHAVAKDVTIVVCSVNVDKKEHILIIKATLTNRGTHFALYDQCYTAFLPK